MLASSNRTIIDKSNADLQGMRAPYAYFLMRHSSIGQANVHVTDTLLESMSQYLPQLEHLNLAGCPRVTNEGVWSMIRNNARNFKGLCLESLSPAFASLSSSSSPELLISDKALLNRICQHWAEPARRLAV